MRRVWPGVNREPNEVAVGIMIANNVESAPGEISPRAAHRSGREPPDSSGSCHQEKAATFRQGKEFLPGCPLTSSRRG